MPNYNVGEYGQTIRVNLNEDVTTATAYKVILEPQYGDKLERVDANGVNRGTSNVTEGDETFIADEYLEYTFKVDELNYEGQWRIKGEATMSATNKVISDYRRFQVLA